MKHLSTANKPSLVVLDLMMPKMSGVDVLKFIRSKPDLKGLPVIVFSNSYMSDMAQAAAIAGADKALLKSRCPPSILVEVIEQTLSGKPVRHDDAVFLAAADYGPTMAAAVSEPVLPPRPFSESEESPEPARRPEKPPGSLDELREQFFIQAPTALKTLQVLLEKLLATDEPQTRQSRLVELYRKVHFLNSMAGLSACLDVSRFVGAFEALLFELQEKPGQISASTLQTIEQSVEFMGQLFAAAKISPVPELRLPNVLVVDDDVMANRLVIAALHRANMKATSEANSIVALNRLREKAYDLVLLDISMPDLDGFQLCAELRKLPGYQKTPVIFVTAHVDFRNRMRSMGSGGNDLIGKPIMPIELAVKAVTHILRNRMANAAK
jgi:CheY-like chemotaxis protein